MRVMNLLQPVAVYSICGVLGMGTEYAGCQPAEGRTYLYWMHI